MACIALREAKEILANHRVRYPGIGTVLKTRGVKSVTLDVSIDARADHIHVQVSGAFDMGEATKGVQEALAICMLRKLTILLVDKRELQKPPTFSEMFMHGDSIAEMYNLYLDAGYRPVRLALVVAEGYDESITYAREIGQSHAFDVLMTTDMAEAMEWLGVDC
jgi:hypothetical protein